MAEQRALRLDVSINTDVIEKDVAEWPAEGQPDVAQVIENTGIERDGGVTNLGYVDGSETGAGYNPALSEIFYTSTGKKVALHNKGYFEVFSGGVLVGTVPAEGVSAKAMIPFSTDDVMVTTAGTLLTVTHNANIATIYEIDPATMTVLNSRTVTTGVFAAGRIFFVRRDDPTYANAEIVVTITVTGFLHIGMVLPGSVVVPVGQTGFNETAQIMAYYHNGYIFCAQDRNESKVFCFSSAMVQQGTFTEGTYLTLLESGGNPALYAFRDVVAAPLNKTNYAALFVPPAAPGGAWTITALVDGDIVTPAAVIMTMGGICIAYANGAGTKRTKYFAPAIAATTITTNHLIPCEMITGLNSHTPYEVTFSMGTVLGIGTILGVSFSTVGIPVPVFDVGIIDGFYCPHVLKLASGDYFIACRRGDGLFCYAVVSITIPVRMQEIAPGVVKINSISAQNVVDSNANRLQVAGSAWNGTMIITMGAGAANHTVVARSKNRYGGSVDAGIKILSNTNGIITAVYSIVGMLYSGTMEEYFDIFLDANYKLSIKPGDSVTMLVRNNLDGTLYVPDTILPNPIGSVIGEKTIRLIATTAIRELNYDGYVLGNEVTGNYVSFTLFGRLYIFDGRSIYYVTLENNLIASVDFTADAIGLDLLAQAPDLVYFLSAFDNSIYTFGGGQVVSKWHRFSRLDPIKAGIYNTRENTLALFTSGTANKIIFIRDGVISSITSPYAWPWSSFSTEDGIWLAKATAARRYSYSDAGATVLTLSWRSKYRGYSSRTKQTIERYLFRAFKEDKVQADVAITYNYFDEDGEHTETRTITIGSAGFPYDSMGYAYFEYIPTKKLSIGASIGLSSALKVVLLDAIVTVAPSGGLTAALNRGT